MYDVFTSIVAGLAFAGVTYGFVSLGLYLGRSSDSGVYCRAISEKYIDYNMIEVEVADGVKTTIQQHVCQSVDGKVNVYTGWNE